MKNQGANWVTFLLALFGTLSASTAEFARHKISPPEGRQFSPKWRIVWIDQNDDQLTDLVAIAPDGVFHLYRQARSGFPMAPDISIPLAPSTVWFTLADVQPAAHHELVYGAEGGIYAVPLAPGSPPPKPQLLHATPQAIDGSTADGPPVYLGSPSCRLNALQATGQFPVLGTDSVTVWQPRQTEPPSAPGTFALRRLARLNPSHGGSNWGTAAGPAYRMAIVELGSLPDTSMTDAAQWPEEVRKRLPELRKRYKESKGSIYFSMNDAGGDTQNDLLVYSYRWGLDPKTMVIVFIRAQDGALPPKPSYVLRCRGIPIEWDFAKRRGFRPPFYDVNGDGLKDIVMIEMKNKPMASRSFVEALLTEGVDWVVTIRLRQQNRPFRSRPDVKFPIIGLPPAFDENGAMAIVDKDFTGDGRPDLLIRRTLSRMQLYESRSDNSLFTRKPQLTFVVPAHGPKRVTELNGDTIADLYLTDTATGDIVLYLSR